MSMNLKGFLCVGGRDPSSSLVTNGGITMIGSWVRVGHWVG